MKKILMIAGIFLPLLMFGSCQTQEHKTETKFEQDLRGLYAKMLHLGNHTRAGESGEWQPLTQEEVTALFEEIEAISTANGVPEIVAQSGYYKGEILDFATADIYDILQWVEANGTPEFYNLMLSMQTQRLTLDDIICNENLMPNEKIALAGTKPKTDADINKFKTDDSANEVLGGGGGVGNSCEAKHQRALQGCQIAYNLSMTIAGTLYNKYDDDSHGASTDNIPDWVKKSIEEELAQCQKSANDDFNACKNNQ